MFLFLGFKFLYVVIVGFILNSVQPFWAAVVFISASQIKLDWIALYSYQVNMGLNHLQIFAF